VTFDRGSVIFCDVRQSLQKGEHVIKRLLVLVATLVTALTVAGSALAGYDYVGASQGVYARIGPTPYTNAFDWYRVMGGPTYSWYVYTSGGSLQGSGISQTNPNGGWSGGYNYRYWKFYNGSPGVQGFDVYWP
jgi:hypothetical protein